MGERAYEQARICYGRPAADSELTEDYNPLEAGLQPAVSLTKVGTCRLSASVEQPLSLQLLLTVSVPATLSLPHLHVGIKRAGQS